MKRANATEVITAARETDLRAHALVQPAFALKRRGVTVRIGSKSSAGLSGAASPGTSGHS